MKHTIIIGNGISGITAARTLRKNSNDEKITVISAESKHFYSRTALMYIYMGHMNYEHTKPYEDSFWQKNRIDLVFKKVERIDFDKKTLHFSDNGSITYDNLVLALGSKWNKPNIKGLELKGVSGLYSLQDLEYIQKESTTTKKAIVVGGGLIGIELAEMFHSKGIEVTFLVREPHFWGNILPKEDAEFIEHHIRKHNIDLRLNTELDEIIGDEHNHVKGVRTTKGEFIEGNFVGLSIGVSPNIDFVKNTALETNRGILVNPFLETNLPNVYALGDCAEFKEPSKGRRSIEQVWYTGRMMGEALGKTLAGQKTPYKPGNWFNSAKFFDIEYQSYGNVSPKIASNESTFFWQHPTKEIAVRLNFDSSSKQFLGINTYGMRLRHELLDIWLTEKRTVNFVIENLRNVNFDTEFYAQNEKQIIEAFNKQFGTTLVAKPKSWTTIFSKL